MIIENKELSLNLVLLYNASKWGHKISKMKLLVYTTNKVQNSPALTK